MNKYIRNNGSSKGPVIMGIILLVIVIAWVMLERAEARSAWEPDVIYPMANQHIELRGWNR